MAGTKSGKTWHPTPTRSTWIPVAELLVDDAYQRPLNRRKVNEIKKDFDPDAIGVIYVSERDDRFYVLDGQTRREAVMDLWGPKEKVPCLVYADLTREDEARLFAQFNEKRTKPRPLDIFRAKVMAGDTVACAITDMVEHLGLIISAGLGPKVSCVQHMTAVYHHGGPDVLERTLRVIVNAWGADQKSVQGTIVQGVGLLVSRHRSTINDDRLVQALSGVSPEQVIAKARFAKEAVSGVLPGASALGRIDTTIAQQVIHLYNKGLRDAAKLLTWDDRRASARYWDEIPYAINAA